MLQLVTSTPDKKWFAIPEQKGVKFLISNISEDMHYMLEKQALVDGFAETWKTAFCEVNGGKFDEKTKTWDNYDEAEEAYSKDIMLQNQLNMRANRDMAYKTVHDWEGVVTGISDEETTQVEVRGKVIKFLKMGDLSNDFKSHIKPGNAIKIDAVDNAYSAPMFYTIDKLDRTRLFLTENTKKFRDASKSLKNIQSVHDWKATKTPDAFTGEVTLQINVDAPFSRPDLQRMLSVNDKVAYRISSYAQGSEHADFEPIKGDVNPT